MTALRWDLGPLDLIHADAETPYTIETLADGHDFGSPQAQTYIRASLLQDGSLVVKTGDDNRTVAFTVCITAGDSEGLAQGEQALALQVGRRNTLKWASPDGYGETTVFQVLTSVMKHEPGHDLDLVLIPGTVRQYWTVTATCLPFAESDGVVKLSKTVSSGGPVTWPLFGSQRTPGSIKVHRTSGNLGDTLVYVDPTMSAYGWNPAGSSRQYAPAADSNGQAAPFIFYVQFTSATWSAGATIELTILGQTIRTRLSYSVTSQNLSVPVGKVWLGGNRNGLVGDIGFIASTLTGISASSQNYLSFRAAPEASLIHVRGMTGTDLNIDIPSLTNPRGGVYAIDGTSVLSGLDAWNVPNLIPSYADIWATSSNTSTLTVTLTHTPRHHTFATHVPGLT